MSATALSVPPLQPTLPRNLFPAMLTAVFIEAVLIEAVLIEAVLIEAMLTELVLSLRSWPKPVGLPLGISIALRLSHFAFNALRP
jgi:hypothetical protein